MKDIIIIGAGGHAKTIVDSIERQGVFRVAGFVDKEDIGKKVYKDYKVLSDDSNAKELFNKGIRYAFIAVGHMGNGILRERLYRYYTNIGFEIPTIIDSTAVVANTAVVGSGTYIGRNAVVNVEANIGDNCIVNTSAIIEHECTLGDNSHIAVAAVVCGQSSLGKNVFLGANATVIQQLNIGDNVIIGAGATVINNLSEGVYAGTPVRRIK